MAARESGTVVVTPVGGGRFLHSEIGRRLIVSRLGSRTSSDSRQSRTIRPPRPVWARRCSAAISASRLSVSAAIAVSSGSFSPVFSVPTMSKALLSRASTRS